MIYFTPKTDCVQTAVELLQRYLNVDRRTAEIHVDDCYVPTDGLSYTVRAALADDLKRICVCGIVYEKHGAESLAEAHIPNRGLHVERPSPAPTEYHRHLTAGDLHLGDIFFVDGEPERVFVATQPDHVDRSAIESGKKSFAVGSCELSTGYQYTISDPTAKVVLFTGSKLVLGKQVAFIVS